MNSIRYFKDRAKAQHRAQRATDPTGALGTGVRTLQQVQHAVAVAAGFRSWAGLLSASEAERQLVIVMDHEPTLCKAGFGHDGFASSYAARVATFRRQRAELRDSAEHVDQVREWLVANIAPRKSVNERAGSYTLKHIAEDVMGEYVMNGELIAAAIIAGYAYRRPRPGDPNTEFAMSQPSITTARRVAHDAKEARLRARAY